MTTHAAFLSSITVQIVIIHASFSYGLWFRNAYRNVSSILGPLLSWLEDALSPQGLCSVTPFVM
jgi:hypothetical protein